MEELFDIYDAQRNHIGSAPRRECHGNPALIHRTAHVVVIHPESGDILLQKRNMTKDIQPGKWDTAVGGHLALGEDFETGAKRELAEELGIDDAELFHIFDSKIRNDIESEDVRVFGAFIADGFTFDPGEIDEIRFWNRATLEAPENRRDFTPNLITELELLKLSGKFYPPEN
jgi:isopentenyldiphosphate isomerase